MSTNSIVVVGASGRIGSAVLRMLASEMDDSIVAISSKQRPPDLEKRIEWHTIDVNNRADLKAPLMAAMPRVIVNAAAMTNVDACETDKHAAWMLNVTLPENLARISRIVDAHLIHFSTDYVFDGIKGPYDERATPNPISYYGKSKLAGENMCVQGSYASTILRTNVVYGPSGEHPDFVQWVCQSLSKQQQIRVVNDQFSNPTFLDDCVEAVRRVIVRKRTGVYHVGGADYISRYDFACRVADFFLLDKSLIQSVTTAELGQAARRPLLGGLVSLKADVDLGLQPSSIQNGLVATRHILATSGIPIRPV